MAKSACLLALFAAVVFCAEAVRIDPPRVHPRGGKHFFSVGKDDPRCRGMGNRQIPDEKNCKRFYKCSNGKSRPMVCPGNFKFDSVARTCEVPEKAICAETEHSVQLDADVTCPSTYGYYPYTADCHKFVVCVDGKPSVKDCDPNTYYNDVNGGCVPGDCSQQYSGDESVCKNPNRKYPDKKDCQTYIHCINGQPTIKQCPHGHAFDVTQQKCTRDQWKKCKNNDILHIGQDDE